MNENLVQEFGILSTQYDDVVRERDALQAKVAAYDKSFAMHRDFEQQLARERNDALSDLANARTAAELAATHREALEQLVREYCGDCQCNKCKRATELL